MPTQSESKILNPSHGDIYVGQELFASLPLSLLGGVHRQKQAVKTSAIHKQSPRAYVNIFLPRLKTNSAKSDKSYKSLLSRVICSLGTFDL